jgi:hypothetical protein
MTDSDRYRLAHTAYWSMLALDSRAFDALPEERKQQYRQETARLRRILTELGPKLRDRALAEARAADESL